MHEKIHHSKRDGSPIPAEECKILETVFNGVRAHSDDEVFWRADGSSFFVEYSSFPQYKDGEIIGCVISFEDITERKKTEERINYLRNHDTLTGLYNRSWLNEELIRINKQKNLPVSVVFGDVNGLKLTNDIFGHSAGDELLKKSADILKRVCGDLDTVARVGGDEVLILLPKTDSEKAEKIIAQIRTEFSKTQVAAIKCSISLGYDTKTEPEQDIERIMENAENKMYKEKTINRKSINTTMVNTIIASLHSRSLRERMHSLNVSELCEKIASAMELSETEVRRAKDAGFLHDIGKIVLPESLITQKPKLTAEEKRELQQHSVIGYRILNLFDNTLDLAEGVYSHHEAWNGSGYPKGIKEKEIPIISRIIAVAEAYDSFTNNTRGEPLSKQEALTKLRERAGSKLDPRVVEALITIIGRESLPTDNKQEFSAK
jgi:diguanylate cyclase (GGDEF)-like protein/putative nucleotidyltransferase with HDIG domain